MNPILTENETRALDELTINSGHLSQAKLMENAGRNSAEYFMENIYDPFSKTVLVICGKGNNGGDGIVAHYYLLKYGVNSKLLLMAPDQLDRDLFEHYYINRDTIMIFNEISELERYDWVYDAIFGIGLQRDITGKYAQLIEYINTYHNVISIDIPSGIYTDTGSVAGTSVKAKFTLTMGYPKIGHFLSNGKTNSGEVVTLDIGFKPIAGADHEINSITAQDIADIIRPYKHDVHKYSRGKVLTVAGSKGMTGAGILTARSAYRAGCGMVRAIVPSSLNNIFESNLIETITLPVEDEDRGYLSIDNYTAIVDFLDWAHVFICGPGLSTAENSQLLISKLLQDCTCPLVLDASGFEPLIYGKFKISDLPAKTILLPHIGEFKRIFNMDILDIRNDPLAICRSVRDQLDGRVLVLKGSPTFIISTDGAIFLIKNGNPILATAGTGDVLTGLIGGYLAQGYSLDEATILGAFLHAEAGNTFMEKFGSLGLIASDLPDLIPETINKILNGN